MTKLSNGWRRTLGGYVKDKDGTPFRVERVHQTWSVYKFGQNWPVTMGHTTATKAMEKLDTLIKLIGADKL